MSIIILDQLNNKLNSPKKSYALANIEDIELDAKNPRFASSAFIENESSINELQIIRHLTQYGKLIPIMNSIIKNNGLYWEEWLSCIRTHNNKLIVLEGNRRISACKALLDISLIPEDRRPEINPIINPQELKSNISTIRVIIYEDAKDAQNFITAKHTTPEIKKWETFEQYNYFYSQFIQGTTIDQITKHTTVSMAKIIKGIKQYGIFKNVFDATKNKYPNLEIEETSILPLVEKFMPTLISKDAPFGLNLFYNDTLYLYSPTPAKADIYNEILCLIGEAFFIREPLKGKDTSKRDNSNIYRISSDEIKSKAKVKPLIDNDIRIPGLKSLICAYQELPMTEKSDREAIVSATQEQPTDSPSAPATPSSNMPESAAVTENTPQNTPSQKEYEFFEDLDYSSLNPQQEDDLGLFRICKEIVKISTYNSNAGYKNFPIASTFLLRSLIEQTLTRQLKKHSAYNKLCNGNPTKTPLLETIINYFKKQGQNANYKIFNQNKELADLFLQTFDGGGTKHQLDTVIHRPYDIQPDSNFLNALSKQGIKKIIQTFISNIYTETPDA